MLSRGTVETLQAIWPEIKGYLETDLDKVKDRLVQAVNNDEIRSLQGRGKSLIALLNLPADLAKELAELEEEARLEELKRMTRSGNA